jgi:hypothetical protein
LYVAFADGRTHLVPDAIPYWLNCLYTSVILSTTNLKAILPLLFAVVMIASLAFTVEMCYLQNSTTGSNDLSAINSSSGRLVNPENLQIILRNDTSGNSDNGQQILLITGGMAQRLLLYQVLSRPFYRIETPNNLKQ